MNPGGVAEHYTQGNLLDRVLDGLRAVGKDPEHLSVEDLAPADHFHVLGLKATLALAEAAGLSGDEEVLDAGCGLGGPARTLAATYGCRVTGIDLTPEYCETARKLNRMVGLEDRITIQEGNLLALPYEDRSFDVVWTMHVTMNIEDKTALYDQLARVLRPGGKLAFFDLIAGADEPYYPLPWANDPSISFLATEAELRADLSAAGFHLSVWQDETAAGAAFFASAVPSPLGPQLLTKDMPVKLKNLGRSLEDSRVRAIRGVCTLA